MSDSNRKSAYRVLWDVERKGAYSNLALSSVIAREQPENPPFVRELVYGVLEEQMLLDHTIARYLKQPLAKLGTAEKLLLRMGVWQLDFAQKIPPFAAVSETVNLAKQVAKGREGFINAVLRAYLREPVPEGKEQQPKCLALLEEEHFPTSEFLSAAYSAAPWIVETWVADYGEAKAAELLKASHQSPDLVLRPNPLRTGGEPLEALRRQLPETVQLTAGRVCPTAIHARGSNLLDTEAFRQGWFSVQDEASQYAVQILDPHAGETVYDLCAAPGGKTLAIAERMQTEARQQQMSAWGRLIACDVHEGKLHQIGGEAARLGLDPPALLVRNGADPGSDPLPKGSAHRVLVDAPCSGLGVLRRKPEIKLRERDPQWEQLPVKQRAILEQSAPLVCEGGILLYSTCTVCKAENQQVAHAFLADHPEFVPVTERQFFPGEEGTDGFYLCAMKRRKETQ